MTSIIFNISYNLNDVCINHKSSFFDFFPLEAFLGAGFLGAGFLGAGFLGAGFLGAGFFGAGFLAALPFFFGGESYYY